MTAFPREESSPSLTEILKVAKEAYAIAAAVIKEKRSSFTISFKGSRDLVTDADKAAEAIILSHIRKAFPTHTFLAEESTQVLSSFEEYQRPLWVIDPIDGTTNFAHGHFHVAISIAYLNHGVIQMGLVGAPFEDEVFWASRGEGAFLNGKKISASAATSASQVLVGTGFPYDRSKSDEMEILLERLKKVILTCRDVRRIGAAALDLCWVACGRLDAYYETVNPWDMAAGALIAKEAGALVGHTYPTNFRVQNPWNLPPELDAQELLVSAPGVFTEMLELLGRE